MFGKRRSAVHPLPSDDLADVRNRLALAEARLAAMEASAKGLEATHKALDARIDAAEHIAKSARGYVTKKLALYEDENAENADDVGAFPRLRLR